MTLHIVISLFASLVLNMQMTLGNPKHPSEVPYNAVILFHVKAIPYSHCGATIIAPDAVLSSAHCFASIPRGFSGSVRVGTSDGIKGGQLVGIARYILHPHYDPETRSHDLALVKLNPQLTWTSSVKPVLMPPSIGYRVSIGTSVNVSGYGMTPNKVNQQPMSLDMTELRVIEPEKCQNIYGKMLLDTNSIICTEGHANNDADTCKGDEGGPLVFKGILVGVVSFGNGCGEEGKPAVFNRVAKDLEWIYNTAVM